MGSRLTSELVYTGARSTAIRSAWDAGWAQDPSCASVNHRLRSPARSDRAKKVISAKWLERSSPTGAPGVERMLQIPRAAIATSPGSTRAGTSALLSIRNSGQSSPSALAASPKAGARTAALREAIPSSPPSESMILSPSVPPPPAAELRLCIATSRFPSRNSCALRRAGTLRSFASVRGDAAWARPDALRLLDHSSSLDRVTTTSLSFLCCA
jgi:hypothetical protein